MNRACFQRYQLVLTPISPVHIGSGNSVEPYEYLLVRQGGNGWLVVIDLPKLLSNLSKAQRTEFELVNRRGDFPGVRKWIADQADQTIHRKFAVLVQGAAFDELEESIDNPNRACEIELMTRDAATGRAFIPGSSIKGAIRTAVLDTIAAGRPRDAERFARDARGRNSQLFEAQVMGNLNEKRRADLYHDPFRQIAISDVVLPEDSGFIDRVKIFHPEGEHTGQPRARGRQPSSGIQMHRDLTWSALDDEVLAGTGELRLFDNLTKPHSAGNRKSRPVLEHTFDLATITNACNRFYKPRLEDELERFGAIVGEQNAKTLRNEAQLIADNQCLIRIGRHAHFECVTLSDPLNKPGPRGVGATRSYAEGFFEHGSGGAFPLGWAKLSFEPISSSE